MGYTHYWRRPKSITKNDFRQWSEDVEKILAHVALATNVAIVNGNGEAGTRPEVTADLVAFNGEEGPEDLSHETFVVERVYVPYSEHDKPEKGRYFAFCKTAYKPYDLAVCAALIRLKLRCPKVQLSSDGGPRDWVAAIMLCEEVFQEGHVLPEGIAPETSPA